MDYRPAPPLLGNPSRPTNSDPGPEPLARHRPFQAAADGDPEAKPMLRARPRRHGKRT